MSKILQPAFSIVLTAHELKVLDMSMLGQVCRPVNPQPSFNTVDITTCLFEVVGTKLVVLEKWRVTGGTIPGVSSSGAIKIEYVDGKTKALLVTATEARTGMAARKSWHPANTMPLWASRHKLEVVSIDAKRMEYTDSTDLFAMGFKRLSDLFETWNTNNPDFPWDSNLWCWITNVKEVTIV